MYGATNNSHPVTRVEASVMHQLIYVQKQSNQRKSNISNTLHWSWNAM